MANIDHYLKQLDSIVLGRDARQPIVDIFSSLYEDMKFYRYTIETIRDENFPYPDVVLVGE